MAKFIGRRTELGQLSELANKKSASFIIIKGRRRIGKSRLIKEFSKNFEFFYSFTGVAPNKNTTSQDQLSEFCLQVARNFKSPPAKYSEWSDAFWAVGERVKTGKTLLVFDEISWMGSKDGTFLGKIKNFWDLQLKDNDKLVFIICGSASSWIEKNILSNTGFVGRISFTLTLDELPLVDCNDFWPKNISVYEKLKVLAVTGGVPKYLEEIDPNISAEENIRKLCFRKGGFLVNEFEQIFSDIFMRRSIYYKKILKALSMGAKEQSEILVQLNSKFLGRIPEYLGELELAGFITRDFTWNIQTGQDVESSRYRLSDNYIRFYLKYIEKNLTKIERRAFDFKSLASLPEWFCMMGLQFENLVLNNRRELQALLKINPEEIICENPYFQRKTSRFKGCQIDYMIQTRFNTLYVCEIKFSQNPIGASIIDELQEKINALKFPKRFSHRPVLVHVNGVTEEVINSNYFSAIIDFGDLLRRN